MSLFEKIPYTNFHELNLSWLLKFTNGVKKQLDKIDDSVAAAKASELAAAESEAGALEAQTAAEDAATEAAGEAADAADSAAAALVSQQAAEDAKTAAQSAAAQAGNYASGASSSAQQAAQSAAAASQSAQQAAASASTAQSAATDMSAAVQQAQAAAQAAQTNAANAGTSAVQAAASAQSAATAGETAYKGYTKATRNYSTHMSTITGPTGWGAFLSFDCDEFTSLTGSTDYVFDHYVIIPLVYGGAVTGAPYRVVPDYNYNGTRNGHRIPIFRVINPDGTPVNTAGVDVNVEFIIISREGAAIPSNFTPLTSY